MGLALSSLPVGKRVATGAMCALFHRKILPLGPGSGSFSGSSVLGVAVVQREEMLAFACLMFCLLVHLALYWEALVVLA